MTASMFAPKFLQIFLWKRGKQVATFTARIFSLSLFSVSLHGHIPLQPDTSDPSPIYLLYVFGHQLLLSFSRDRQVEVWLFKSAQSNAKLQLSVTATCVVHPDAYLNKILIGSEEGPLQLWNLKTQKMIFEFKVLLFALSTCSDKLTKIVLVFFFF
jgi:WD40 repeat protein